MIPSQGSYIGVVFVYFVMSVLHCVFDSVCHAGHAVPGREGISHDSCPLHLCLLWVSCLRLLLILPYTRLGDFRALKVQSKVVRLGGGRICYLKTVNIKTKFVFPSKVCPVMNR